MLGLGISLVALVILFMVLMVYIDWRKDQKEEREIKRRLEFQDKAKEVLDQKYRESKHFKTPND